MKKILAFTVLTLLLAVSPLKQAHAASPTVYVSVSSSSVTVGSKFTATVGVISNGKTYDTLEATLNYSSSKVSYVSHTVSSGVFATEDSNSGSSFNFTGAVLGGTASNKTFFTVTFKAKASGSASLSLSGVRVLSAGSSYSGVATSGNSITVKDQSSGSTNPKESTSTDSGSTFNPEPGADNDPPELNGKVEVEKTQSRITLNFKSNEKAKSKVTYTLDKKTKNVSSDKLVTSHKVVLGEKQPLEPGRTYKITIRLTDKEDNSAKVKTLEVRTQGVDYKVKISDRNGSPLVNHPVTLYSDPIESTTNEEGVAEFKDVTPGEHTLVFEIDGLTMRHPVKVGQIANLAGANEEVSDITLPVSFAEQVKLSDPQEIIKTNWLLVMLAAVIGAAAALLIKPKKLKKLSKRAKRKYKKAKANHHIPEVIKPNKKK